MTNDRIISRMKLVAPCMALVAILGAQMAAVSAQPIATQPDGAVVYKRCAACHLANRGGVPGAFPPLKADVAAFAKTPEGRRYLVLVLAKGLSGPIKAEGRTYMGVMPAQGMLSVAEAGAVLNFIAQPAKKFTADEVTRLRASGSGLTAAQVAQLNGKLTGR